VPICTHSLDPFNVDMFFCFRYFLFFSCFFSLSLLPSLHLSPSEYLCLSLSLCLFLSVWSPRFHSQSRERKDGKQRTRGLFTTLDPAPPPHFSYVCRFLICLSVRKERQNTSRLVQTPFLPCHTAGSLPAFFQQKGQRQIGGPLDSGGLK